MASQRFAISAAHEHDGGTRERQHWKWNFDGAPTRRTEWSTRIDLRVHIRKWVRPLAELKRADRDERKRGVQVDANRQRGNATGLRCRYAWAEWAR
jgi:hypothetical protein